MRSATKEGHKAAGHDVNFKPAKAVADKPYKAAYPHMVDRVDVKKNFRGEDGHVVAGPSNFYTSPAKKGKVGK